MKKLTSLAIILLVAIQFSSCKSDQKKTEKTTVKKEAAFAFDLSQAKHTIGWVGYKTTDKVAVKGEFQKVEITSGGKANTIAEAIDNAEFSIPVSSIFSGDNSRDFKLKKFLFSAMKDTKLLGGKFSIESDSIGSVDLMMNGVLGNLPFKYSIEGKTFTMTATMDIHNWNAQSAVESLNEACKDLHKGADGVTKTWSEVAINITSEFK